jgi:hypothetical protein
VDLTPYNDYGKITCCDFRKNGLELSGCLKQFELFSKAIHRDYRYFGILLATILLRRALSPEERAELLDDKAVYKDLVGMYGVLNLISRRCSKEMLSVLELCFRPYVPLKKIKKIQEVLHFIKDDQDGHKSVMDNWLNNNSIIKKEAEEEVEKLKIENEKLKYENENYVKSKKEEEDEKSKNEIEKLKNELKDENEQGILEYDIHMLHDSKNRENKNRILAIVCTQQHEAYEALHALGGTNIYNIFMFTYLLCLYERKCICICICVCVYDYIYMHVCVYVYLCVYTYLHTCTYVHT